MYISLPMDVLRAPVVPQSQLHPTMVSVNAVVTVVHESQDTIDGQPRCQAVQQLGICQDWYPEDIPEATTGYGWESLVQQQTSFPLLPSLTMPKPSPFQSRKILFLDVDGVVLPWNCSSGLEVQLDMMKRLIHIEQATKCDIVVSSSWQFQQSRVAELVAFLDMCGFGADRVHTMTYLLAPTFSKAEYEKAPYCQSRGQGILKVIETFKEHIDHWIAIDDLPLAASDFVAVPKKEDLEFQVEIATRTCLLFAQRYYVDSQNVSSWYPVVRSEVESALTVDKFPKNIPKKELTRGITQGAMFSKKALLFGWKASGDHCRAQAIHIVNCSKMTADMDDIAKEELIQVLSSGILGYVNGRMSVMGTPDISSRFVRTEMYEGLTDDQAEIIVGTLINSY